MSHKAFKIIVNAIPVVVLIALIPLVQNDYFLTLIYFLAALLAFAIKREKNDLVAYLFGLIGITISEYFFIQTGVETFTRQSLFGIMPFWLPFLWAYAFVVIKRSLQILS